MDDRVGELKLTWFREKPFMTVLLFTVSTPQTPGQLLVIIKPYTFSFLISLDFKKYLVL